MKKLNCIVAAVGCLFSAAVVASPITYSYVGTVYQANGASNVVNIGDKVTGTFTVDFANGNPLQSSSPSLIGTPSFWTVSSWGMAPNVPSALVFSLTANLSSTSYVSHAPGPLYGSSYVNEVGGGGMVWQGLEAQEPNLTDRFQSTIYLAAVNPPAYAPNALPILTNINWSNSYGAFATRVNQQMQEDVAWRFNSIQVAVVPEPETYAMFLAGLGIMGAVARRRKQA